MIHCISTPFFFIATTCSASCCSVAPQWWQWLDYFFLFISFFAVRQSYKITNSKLVKYGLSLSWIGLFLFIINTKADLLYLSENLKYIPAFSLIGFHFYNFKFCRCETNLCFQDIDKNKGYE